MQQRDFKEKPYSADEARVAAWFCKHAGIGGGDNPIGSLIASHEMLAAQRNKLREGRSIASYTAADARSLAEQAEKLHGFILDSVEALEVMEADLLLYRKHFAELLATRELSA